jgi:pimeloyl-ACP methyl ester carboxylesterase
MLATPSTMVKAFDGTSLAVYERGSKKNPPLILANGLGGNFDAWEMLVRHFSRDYRILSWDYRGLYHSGPSPQSGLVPMEHHVRDVEVMLDAMGVEKAVFLGWSMGVQLNFEIARHMADRVVGIVGINGTYASPFKTVFGVGVPEPVADLICAGFRAAAPLMSHVGGLLHYIDYGLPVARALGFVGEDIMEDMLREVVKDFVQLDFEVYGNTLAGLGEHDATEFLPEIAVPVLILGGEKDFLTPARCSKEMAAMIPGAVCHILPRSTHYAPLECPQKIIRHTADFLGGIEEIW